MAMMNEFLYGESDPAWISDSYLPYAHEVDPYAAHSLLPSVELMVPMCCLKCEEKVREELLELEGVYGVVTDQPMQKVIVSGHVNPLRVLTKARRVKRKAQFWPSPSYSQYAARDQLMLPEKSYLHHGAEYRPSYSQYTPTYGHSYIHDPYGPSYRLESYNPSIVTNPYYMKHIESEY